MTLGNSNLHMGLWFLVIFLTLQGCEHRESGSLWTGTWKLDASKSQAYGSYFTIAIASDGLITVTNEAYDFSFRCDDTEFKNGTNHTTVCIRSNNEQWNLSGRTDGKDAGTSIWKISPDGTTFTIRSNEIQNGASQAVEMTYIRRSGTNGFAGQWQDTAPLRNHPKILEIGLNGKRLHLEYPEIGQYSDSLLGGVASPVHGPRVKPGSTIFVSATSPRQLSTQQMFSGKVIRYGTMDISDDGRTLLQESWKPESPSERDRLIYNKQ